MNYQTDKLVETLTFFSEKSTLVDMMNSDDGDMDSVFDWSGSNVDDAYERGLDDGKVLFARELLSFLKKGE